MSVRKVRKLTLNNISCIVSRSIKDQNKYLFNYANKLEFLICQTHKERANHDFKFKKMVSHIVDGLTHKSIMTKETDRSLKLVQVMTAEDTLRTTKIEQTLSDALDDDFLREALISGPKSSNYLNQGFASETRNKDPLLSDIDEDRGTTNVQVEGLGSVKWNLNRLRHTAPIMQLFQNKRTQGTGSYLSGQDEKFSEFIQAEWNNLEQVKSQAVKRKIKEKFKELKVKHSASESIPNNHDFNNEMFNNLEISRRDTTPNQIIGKPLGTNGGGDAFHRPLEVNIPAYGVYSHADSSYTHSNLGHESSNGFYDPRLNQPQSGTSSEFSMIIKQKLKTNGDSHLDPALYNDQSFMNFPIKGKKRGRKRKNKGQEDY